MKNFLATILVSVGLLGCTSEPTSPPALGVEVPLTRLTTEPSSFLDFSGLAAPTRLVVRDPLVWRAVWIQLYQGRSEPPPLPEIDFSKDEILVAALGVRGSTGYSILFHGASANDSGGVDVVVQSSSPGNGCASLTVLTQPVDIARIPKTSVAVHFVERAIVSNCGQ